MSEDLSPPSPPSVCGWGKSTRSTFHSQLKPGLSLSLQQIGLVSLSSTSGKPSLSCFSSSSLMRQRPISTAWLMLVAVRSLATSPACAERMMVTTAPKRATAIRTSSRENPRRRLHGSVRRVLSIGRRVSSVGTLSSPRLLDGDLPGERGDDQRHGEIVVVGLTDAHLDDGDVRCDRRARSRGRCGRTCGACRRAWSAPSET